MSLFGVVMTSTCFASPLLMIQQSPTYAFMTPRDIALSNQLSKISLKNEGNTATTVYGLYVNQYASVLPGQTCDDAVSMFPGAAPPAVGTLAVGAVVAPVAIPANSAAQIGSNFLYNMLYNANYFLSITVPVSTPGCQLPGCTWGSDSTSYNWCIYLGAIAPVSVSEAYSSKVLPMVEAVTGSTGSGPYQYSLVQQYHYIGPISCNDQTLSCSVVTPQSQSFS